MWYAIIANDRPDSLDSRVATRPAHLARLEILQAQGRLLIAGPNPAIDSPAPGDAGFTGSIIIGEFDSLAEATLWAEQDPYTAAGVYASVVVKPFLKALPK